MKSVDSQIAAFLAKYDPQISRQLLAAREHIRSQFPRGFELVYDNYNALVFAFGSTERAGDLVMSVAGYPRWVTLFFAQGAELDDPNGLLQGKGSRIRSIRLGESSTLENKEVQALIARALVPAKAKLAAAPLLATVIKSVSEQQRPRRSAARIKASV
jgi:hypothetical protein